MNTFIIHGRLVRDPEYTRSPQEESKDRTKFTVAVDRRYGDESDYFDCIVFGRRAAVINKWFSKGSEIMVSGEMQTRSYDDKNGVRRKAYTVMLSDFDFCGSKSDSNGSTPQQTAPKQSAQAQTPTEPEPVPDGFEEIDEDIPF